MQCTHSPAFHSDLSHHLFDSARVLQLGTGSELNRHDSVARSDKLHLQSPSDFFQLRRQQLKQDTDRDIDVSPPPESISIAAIKRSKTNSERGRAFRARRKKFEEDLQRMVHSLRREITDLEFLRSVRTDQTLCSRSSMCGPLVRLTREYFALFERGIPSARGVGSKRPALLTDGTSTDGHGDSFGMKQKAFIMSAMDSELQLSGASGRDALLDQWKKYTKYHASIHVEVVGIEVSGEEDDPIVTVYSDLRVVFSRATFQHIFPHVVHNLELVNKFIGREIIYRGVNRFQFSRKGQILSYDSDVGLVDALVRAGASVSDVALLAQQALIADGCRLEDEDSEIVRRPEYGNQDKITFLVEGSQNREKRESDADTRRNDLAFTWESNESGNLCAENEEDVRSQRPTRLTIDFLLS